jgi:hypothetical protein
MIGMLGQVDGGSSALAYLFLDRIASHGSADQLLSRHAAKLIETDSTG